MRIIRSPLFILTFVTLALVTLVISTPGVLQERQLSAPPLLDPFHPEEPREHGIAAWNGESWTLSTSAFLPNHYQVQPYVANGYHGSRLPAEGMGFWIDRNQTGDWQPVNGWPLDNARQTVSTISGFWDSQHNTTRTNFPDLLNDGGESVISGIPAWSSMFVTTQKGTTYQPGVDNFTISNFHQSLSLRNGVVETSFTWYPDQGGPAYNLTYTVVAHRSRINLGMVKLEISSSESTRLTITDILDGQAAQRTTFGGKGFANDGSTMWTSVKPLGITNVTAYEFSTVEISGFTAQDYVSTRYNAEQRPYVSKSVSTSAQEWRLDLVGNEPRTIVKYVGIASSDAFPDDPMGIAASAAFDAKATGWKRLIQEQDYAWGELWDSSDILIPGDEELQVALRGSLYHLLANLRGGSEGSGIGDNSISVGGLSSDSYAGRKYTV